MKATPAPAVLSRIWPLQHVGTLVVGTSTPSTCKPRFGPLQDGVHLSAAQDATLWPTILPARRSSSQTVAQTPAVVHGRGRKRPRYSICKNVSATNGGVNICKASHGGAKAGGLLTAKAHEARTSEAEAVSPIPSTDSSLSEEFFNWTRAWYPVAVIEDLDPSVPKGFTVLGQKVVLWRDKENRWRCQLDCCPHRFAPLSQGRIHESGGLQCSYHGWVFGPSGDCTLIPQAGAHEAKAAVGSKLACATNLLTAEVAGLVWVWPDITSPPQTPSEQQPAVHKSLIDPAYSHRWMYREMPYNWDTLVENLMDPAHLNFAHHNVQGTREKAEPISFASGVEMSRTGFVVRGLGRVSGIATPPVRFDAPANVSYDFHMSVLGGQWEGSMISLGTPIAPGRVGVFAAFPRNFLRPLANLTPRWLEHLRTSNQVLDGDLVLLREQETNSYNRGLLDSCLCSGKEDECPGEGGPSDRCNSSAVCASVATAFENRRYYMPTSSDRPVIAFRHWLRKYGKNGPNWPPGALRVPEVSTEERLEVLMDRATQHTQHCASCRGAHRNVRRLQGVTQAGVVACIAAAAAISAPDPVGAQLLAASSLLAGALTIALHKLDEQFVYAGPYDHSKK